MGYDPTVSSYCMLAAEGSLSEFLSGAFALVFATCAVACVYGWMVSIEKLLQTIVRNQEREQKARDAQEQQRRRDARRQADVAAEKSYESANPA